MYSKQFYSLNKSWHLSVGRKGEREGIEVKLCVCAWTLFIWKSMLRWMFPRFYFVSNFNEACWIRQETRMLDAKTTQHVGLFLRATTNGKFGNCRRRWSCKIEIEIDKRVKTFHYRASKLFADLLLYLLQIELIWSTLKTFHEQRKFN